MDPRERLKIPRQAMPEQEPHARCANFRQVNRGYDEKLARTEAARCLQCKKPSCVAGCPVEIDIPAFIGRIEEGDFLGAARKLKEKNSLPAVCGRVCPQEEQCEVACVLAKKGQPVAIGHLEAFAADWERAAGKVEIPHRPRPTRKRVAVVGSGPSGLTVAGELAKLGHEVTLFEALHSPGGVLIYGIPEFRLPKEILHADIDYVKKLGVEIRTDFVVGQTATVEELLGEGVEAIFIGSGAGLPTFLNIAGENLNGVYSANEYLTRVNLMRAYRFPQYETPVFRGKRVAVIGGGNTAMDAVRTSKRLGAEQSIILYRRSRKEMPAREEEIRHAEEEGIEFHFLVNPLRIEGTAEGWVSAITCLRMELGEPDESGRCRPVPVPGSEFTLPLDAVVVAVGNGANPLIQRSTKGLATNKWGCILADPQTGRTSRNGLWAGGDIVRGGATVILAMGDGKRAARDMHAFLSGK